MPHPPSCEAGDGEARTSVRGRYGISSRNYGFYVYRNHRLIAWGDHLNGSKAAVPYAKDLYSFRGRMLFSSEADELLNLDVAKSRIQLSEVAENELHADLKEAVKKSRNAWNGRTAALKAIAGEGAQEAVSDEIDRIADQQDREDEIDEGASPREEREERQKRKERQLPKEDPGEGPAGSENRGAVTESKRMKVVDSLKHNALWARYVHSEHGFQVRLNRSHGFYDRYLAATQGDPQMLFAVEATIYAVARAEFEMVYKSDFEDELAEKFCEEFRVRASEILADLTRKENLDTGNGDDAS